MNCEHFGICGSCTLPYSYEEQLDIKISYAKEYLGIKADTFIAKSNDIHYRNRAEFRIWHENENLSYALNKNNNYEKMILKSCPKVSRKIYEIMPLFLEQIAKNELLCYKLFGVEFLSSNEDLVISMLYHKKINDQWLEVAKNLATKLNINIIGRSKGVKLVTNKDYINETLHVNDKKYLYNIYEGAFCQPNTCVNEKMISWVKNSLNGCKDLLELYCGHGNFTIPLSECFDNILATEISKTSIKSALNNCQLNGILNVKFVRMSVEELVLGLQKQRQFNRLKDVDLDSYNFSHVFVDPPRAGLDEFSLQFIKKFDNIIYISCNIQSLKENLKELCKTHKVQKLAFFDQFAYTKHLECGVILTR